VSKVASQIYSGAEIGKGVAGFAAAHCGKALPSGTPLLELEAAPQPSEAQPQKNQSRVAGKPEAYRTVAGGKAASAPGIEFKVQALLYRRKPSYLNLR